MEGSTNGFGHTWQSISKIESEAELYLSGSKGGSESQRLIRRYVRTALDAGRGERESAHNVIDAGVVDIVEQVEGFEDEFEMS